MGGFGTEVHGVGVILGNADKGLEHQVKLLDVGKIVAATLGAGDILFLWVASIPLGALAGLVFGWPSFWIYFLLKIDQVLKSIWCFFRLKSGKWMKKIKPAEEEAV